MVFLLTVVLSFVPAFVYAVILYWLDRYEKEPKLMLFGVFGWGALVATIGAIILSLILQGGVELLTGSPDAADFIGTTLIAPVVEESLKGLAVLLVFLVFHSEFDSVLDGVVYAGIAALGFAATENVLYLYSAYDEGGIGSLFALFFLRVVLGGWNHAMFTAAIGVGLALSRLSRSLLVKLLAPVLGWCVAIFLHALHNTTAVLAGDALGLGGLLALVVIDWVGWLAAFGIILWATNREHRWIATYLQEEVTMGLLTQAQYKVACSAWAQLGAQLRALGTGRFRRTGRFYQLCGELAQKKHQLSTLGEERGNTSTIARLRAELAQIAPTLAGSTGS